MGVCGGGSANIIGSKKRKKTKKEEKEEEQEEDEQEEDKEEEGSKKHKDCNSLQTCYFIYFTVFVCAFNCACFIV
jgi:hypothetical protein